MAYSETTKIADSSNVPVNPATTENQTFMKQMLQLLRPLANVTNGGGRLSIDINNIGNGTVSIGNTPNVSITSFGLTTFELQYLAGRSAYASVVRPQLTF